MQDHVVLDVTAWAAPWELAIDIETASQGSMQMEHLRDDYQVIFGQRGTHWSMFRKEHVGSMRGLVPEQTTRAPG